MVSAILGAISTLGAIVSGVRDIIAFIQASKEEAWFQHWSEAMAALRSAKTTGERQDAARKIRESLGGL